jgi:hypothetical protein
MVLVRQTKAIDTHSQKKVVSFSKMNKTSKKELPTPNNWAGKFWNFLPAEEIIS